MNWIIGTALIIVLTLVVFALYCALIVAGRSDEEIERENNNEGDDEMFWKKKICPRCKTGKDSYDLDKHSEACPYIGCWKNGKCSFYVPLEKPKKMKSFMRSNKDALKDIR